LFIYIDESGDLGFDFTKGGTSRLFIATLLVVHNRDHNRRLVQAVTRTIKNKIRQRKGEKNPALELKGSKTEFSIKIYFLRQLRGVGIGIYSLILNKARVFEELRRNKTKLYNFLARLLIERCPFILAREKIILVLDRSKNQREIREFNQYLLVQIQKLVPEKIPVEIYHRLSHESKGIQAVDLFSWGIFRKYERNDLTWYERFKERIHFEKVYLANKKGL